MAVRRSRRYEDEEGDEEDEEEEEEQAAAAAKLLVARLISSGKNVEEMIVEAADNGQLNSAVLLVIRARLEKARQEDERYAIQALDLLFRRVECEMMKRQASPALRFLHELLSSMDDNEDHQAWLRRARRAMLNKFPPEDGFTILAPSGFNLSQHRGPVDAPSQEDEQVVFRIDFVREVDQLVGEVEAELQLDDSSSSSGGGGLDPVAVAARLKQEQKQRNLKCVVELRDMAACLKWR